MLSGTSFTIASFLFFTALVGGLTYWITRRDDTDSAAGYFLAGRSLSFPLIAGSLLLTNLSTEQLVGLNGGAYKDGLCVMVWEVVCVVALVFMAWFFLPRFLKSGVATVPDYLGIRYDRSTQLIANVIFLVAYIGILLPVILYTCAKGMGSILDIPQTLVDREWVSEVDAAAVNADIARQNAAIAKADAEAEEKLAAERIANPDLDIDFEPTPPLDLDAEGWEALRDELTIGKARLLSVWVIVIAVGVLGSIYALFGGLRTVAVSDTINGVGLFAGGFLVLWFALAQFGGGGVGEGLTKLYEEQTERFTSIGGPETSVPFWTIFSGIFIINLFYWTTNQQIIQRTLGASSLAEGQKGVLLTGALKLLGPLYLVIPGMIAFSMFGDMIDSSDSLTADDAYGLLVQAVLPNWLTGFFAAALLGAILSSFNSALNSTVTLFSYGIYKPLINRQATDAQLIRIGRIAGIVIAVAAMATAPLLDGNGEIFAYLQKMNALYFIPLFAVILTGMLVPRVPSWSANVAMLAGCGVIAIGYFVPPFDAVTAAMNDFQFVGVVFLWLVMLMLVASAVGPRETEFVQDDVQAVDMTPWAGSKYAGWALIAAVLTIYALFADFTNIVAAS